MCSIDLTQLYAKLPINKINLKGFLDEHLVWELPIDPLKDNQHQCFLQSPTFPLSSVSGKISIKLAVYYNHSILDCSHRDGDSSQQDCDFSQQDEVSRNALLYCQSVRLTPLPFRQPTEYTIVFEYWRLRGKPPIAFELMSSQGKIYRPRVEEDIKQSAGEEAYVWIPTKRKRDRGDIFSNGPTRPRRDLGSVRRTIKRMPLRLTGKADRRAPLPVEGGLAEEAAKDGKHDATST